MQHLDEGTIHAWLDGALPPVEAEQVAKHAAECATCAAAVADARGIIAGAARIVSALDDVPGGVIPSGARGTTPAVSSPLWRRLRLTPGRAALAATILVAVSATLTLRSSTSSTPSTATQKDRAVSVAAPAPQPTTKRTPVVFPVTIDSFKVPGGGASSRLANASAANGGERKLESAVQKTGPTAMAEQRVADAVAPRDTSTRELQKVRATAQEAAAVASVAAAPVAAPPASMKASNLAPARAFDARDSATTFEGCYRLSADPSVGSTEMPSGLPTSFTLSRPSADLRAFSRRSVDVRLDSTGVPIAWRQLSTTQANVTFGLGSARQVSLMLTAGSPLGVASSGDRTTTVRVTRASCTP
jgi:hypothetical protein